MASKMAASDAYDVEIAIFSEISTPILQILCLFPHSVGQGSQCIYIDRRFVGVAN